MCTDIGVGIVDKYTGLNITCGVYMEVVSAACNTAAYKFTVILEIYNEHRLSGLGVTHLSQPEIHILSLWIKK